MGCPGVGGGLEWLVEPVVLFVPFVAVISHSLRESTG